MAASSPLALAPRLEQPDGVGPFDQLALLVACLSQPDGDHAAHDCWPVHEHVYAHVYEHDVVAVAVVVVAVVVMADVVQGRGCRLPTASARQPPLGCIPNATPPQCHDTGPGIPPGVPGGEPANLLPQFCLISTESGACDNDDNQFWRISRRCEIGAVEKS